MQNSPSYLPPSQQTSLYSEISTSDQKKDHIQLKRMEENKQTHATCRKKMTRESTTDVWRGLRWIEVRIREFEISLAWHRTTRLQATNYTPHCWKGDVSRSHALFISPNTHRTFCVSHSTALLSFSYFYCSWVTHSSHFKTAYML